MRALNMLCYAGIPDVKSREDTLIKHAEALR